MWGDTLADKTVLVVGAGTQPSADPDAPVGNGRAISVTAARAGAAVVCADRDRDAAEATAELVRAEGAKAHVVVGDVSDAEICRAVVDEAVSFSPDGALDGVVLNVGIGRASGAGLAGTSAENWDLTFAVNLRAHFLVAQAALDKMSAGSAFVFVGSLAGHKPGSMLPAYDASKAGLAGLMRQVALEGAFRQVRANLLSPGLIDTPLGRAASAGRPSRRRAPIPLGREGTAWEVADAAVFLLSAHASYITGQALLVDGGLSLV